MTWALLLLALSAPQDKYEKSAEGVAFPEEELVAEWSRKSDLHRRVLGQITDRKPWARAFRLIDEKLGIFREKPEVEVTFEESADTRPARGGGRNGKGSVIFNLSRLVERERKVEDAEAAKRDGKRVHWVVPPLQFEAVIAHELTHVVCGTFAEKWVTEGIACYVATDEVPLYGFNHRGSRVDGLDLVVPDADSYARGMAFFQWFETRWGRDKMRELADRIVLKREAAASAAAAVTGWSWDRVTVEEKVWSAEWLAKFKPRR